MNTQPDACALCPRLCRHACPVAVATGLESTTPTAIMTNLILHQHNPQSDLSNGIDLCTRCGQCEAVCGIDQPVVAILDEARTMHQPAPKEWTVPEIIGKGSHVAIISGPYDWSTTLKKTLNIECAQMFTTDHLGELHCIRTDTRAGVHEKLSTALGSKIAIVSDHTCLQTLRAAGCQAIHLSSLIDTAKVGPRWRTCGCEHGPGIDTLIHCCGAKAPLSASHPEISEMIANDLRRRFQGQAVYIEDSRCSAHLKAAGAQVKDAIDHLQSMETSNANR